MGAFVFGGGEGVRVDIIFTIARNTITRRVEGDCVIRIGG